MVACFTNNAVMLLHLSETGRPEPVISKILNIIMIVNSSIRLYKSGHYYT